MLEGFCKAATVALLVQLKEGLQGGRGTGVAPLLLWKQGWVLLGYWRRGSTTIGSRVGYYRGTGVGVAPLLEAGLGTGPVLLGYWGSSTSDE